MRRIFLVLAALVFLIPAYLVAAEPGAPIAEKPAATPEVTTPAATAVNEFVVYTDKNARENHFIPSGFMGDVTDIKINDQCMSSPHSGNTCIEFTYGAKGAQGWAGVYWQNPANNWGTKKGGFDLTGMTKLTFWAKGAKGGEIIKEIMVGGIAGTYPDTTTVKFGPIELSDTWKQYTVNLAGKDLTYISGGFGWVTNSDLNSNGATFYLDDIKFEVDPTLKPETRKQEKMPFYIYADRSSVTNHFTPSGWMGSYGDIKIDIASKEDPYLGDTCIKLIYGIKSMQGGARWAGIYWQHPPNNWGNVDAGYDLSLATKLTFWARGEKGGERIEEFKAGGIMGEYSDSDSASIGPVVLNKEWTQYTVDLKGKDMSYIIGGFCWVTNADVNPEGATFYLDEIKYE